MQELDCEESWAPKNWCFWTVVLEKTLESPLDCREIQPVHSKGDQPWVFFGRNDAKDESPVLWPPHVKNWLIGKVSDSGRDWGQEEKVMTENETAGWHHQLDGREFAWTPGDGDGQGGLTCCNSWGCKELDMTEGMNWIELKVNKAYFSQIYPLLWTSTVLFILFYFFLIYQNTFIHKITFVWLMKFILWNFWYHFTYFNKLRRKYFFFFMLLLGLSCGPLAKTLCSNPWSTHGNQEFSGTTESLACQNEDQRPHM